MPPRYAYWTILVDEQPTAFRAGAKEDLLPTFNRLKEKHPSAVMMWFQNGKLWPSRLDAQEAMRARGEMGRRGDARQGRFSPRDREFKAARPRDPQPSRSDRPEWTPKTSRPRDFKTPGSEKLEWKPKGEFTPAPKRSDRPEWKPRSKAETAFRPKAQAGPKPRADWKPKDSFDRDRKPEWKPRTSRPQEPRTARSTRPEWKPKGSFDGNPRPEWKPRGEVESPKSTEKRKWIPKEEYKKAQGIEAKRDAKWRPGGEHRDPRQKYKDAKKAKWTKFKKTIRTRWEAKSKKKS